uniref:RING-type domain-containing protein n=1 Tax=Globodera pallida TaxID=36090 RepID=A0A183C5I3_GLOPA
MAPFAECELVLHRIQLEFRLMKIVKHVTSLQHLQINEAERPSQNSHIMPQGLASSSSALAPDGSNNVVTSECPICLQPLLASEDVEELSSCEHRFHRDCINTWLGHGNTTCPMCRQQVDQNARPNHLPDCPLCRESMQASQIKELHSCRFPSCLCRFMAIQQRRKYDLPSLWLFG